MVTFFATVRDVAYHLMCR